MPRSWEDAELLWVMSTVGGGVEGRGGEDRDTAGLDRANDECLVGSFRTSRSSTLETQSKSQSRLDRCSQVGEGYIGNFFNTRPRPWYSTRAATPGTSSTSSTMASSPFDFVFSHSGVMGVSVGIMMI